MMTVQEAVRNFLAQSTNLYHRLRSKGDTLSDVELTALREQLHILDAEADHLQEVKQSGGGSTHFIFEDRRPRSGKQLNRRRAA